MVCGSGRFAIASMAVGKAILNRKKNQKNGELFGPQIRPSEEDA